MAALHAFGAGAASIFAVPDSSHGEAFFTPDGTRLLARARSSGQLVLYDIARRAPLWQVPGGDRAGVAFSPRGEHAVIVTQRHNDASAALSVVNLRDGSVGATRPLPRRPNTEDTYYSSSTPNGAAVTDDGSTVFLAYDPGVLEIWAADPRAATIMPRTGGYYRRIALDAGGTRLAALHHGQAGDVLYVFDKSGAGWMESARLPGVLWFNWLDGAPATLGIVTARGIEVWSAGAAALAVPLDRNAYEMSGARVPAVFFASGGTHVAVATASSFVVYALPGGAPVFTHAEHVRGAHPGLIVGAAMHGDRLRALLSTGDFIDADLTSRRVTRRIAFGSPGSYSRNRYQDGSSWVSRFRPTLAPGARYVGINEGAGGHKVFELP